LQVKGRQHSAGHAAGTSRQLDLWNFYLARNIRQDVAEATTTQLRLAIVGRAATEAAAYDEVIARHDAKFASEAQKRAELKAQTEQDQKSCDRLNYRDDPFDPFDQFDLSDAALAIAVALLAVAALTRIWWMYWLSWVPITFGVPMGQPGLPGWTLHPDTLTRLLSWPAHSVLVVVRLSSTGGGTKPQRRNGSQIRCWKVARHQRRQMAEAV
jgi:hypothetical protein